jgi:hypothetical protein
MARTIKRDSVDSFGDSGKQSATVIRRERSVEYRNTAKPKGGAGQKVKKIKD